MTRRDAERAAWITGGVGVIGSCIGWLVAPAAFPHAWLAAVVCWIGWPLGSMALILTHALTGGRWGDTIRPSLVLGMTTLPLLLPAVIPVLVVMHALYPWIRADVAPHLKNGFYLNLPFFLGRGAVYMIIWLGLGGLVLRTLRRPDSEALLYRIAPPGLILLALTVSFAAIDVTMSLDPAFKSSVYGMLAACEGALFALAIAVLATVIVAPPAPERLADLGRLMLALLILWAYLDFMQLLIVWQSDLASEAPWYLRRTSGGWAIVAGLTAAGHFFLPFFALLWPGVQRSRRAIMVIAALLVGIEIPRAWWLILPESNRGAGLLDVLTMLAMFGLAAGVALRAPLLSFMPDGVRRHV